MKYAIIIPDGCADEPQESLGGKTPLAGGRISRRWTPWPRPASSAGPTIRPKPCPPAPTRPTSACWATIRWNISPAGRRWRPPPRESTWDRTIGPSAAIWSPIEDQVMKSFTAGHISSPEAAELIKTAQENLGGDVASVLSGRKLSQPVGLSRHGPAGAVLARHPHHSAARPDRQVGAGRLSARAGQRSAEPPDERERAVCSPTIR